MTFDENLAWGSQWEMEVLELLGQPEKVTGLFGLTTYSLIDQTHYDKKNQRHGRMVEVFDGTKTSNCNLYDFLILSPTDIIQVDAKRKKRLQPDPRISQDQKQQDWYHVGFDSKYYESAIIQKSSNPNMKFFILFKIEHTQEIFLHNVLEDVSFVHWYGNEKTRICDVRDMTKISQSRLCIPYTKLQKRNNDIINLRKQNKI